MAYPGSDKNIFIKLLSVTGVLIVTFSVMVQTDVPRINTCDLTNPTDVCKEANTACTVPYNHTVTSLCLCASGYYLTDSQTCVSRDNLKIDRYSLVRHATAILFSWIEQSNRSDVNYNITWNGGSATANKTGGVATSLTPGTPYTFVIHAFLTQDSFYPTIEEQTSYQLWTYPAKPGFIWQITMLPESTPQQFVYDIDFDMSEGLVAYYKLDITGVGITNSTTADSLEVEFQLKPVTLYNYTLTAYNGNSPPDESEPNTGTFLTPPAASGPVLGLSITAIQETSANITWRTPSDPNGNISGYLVQVLEQETGKCLYNIKLPCYNCDQSKPPNASDIICTITETVNSTYDNNTDQYHLELPNLKPYHNYTVVVIAVNVRGNGRPSSTNITTNIADLNISNLTLDSTLDKISRWVNLNISWIPGEYTGPTTYHILVQKEVGIGSKDFQPDNQHIVPDFYTTTLVLYNVQAFWNYTILITAETGKIGWTSHVIQTAPNHPGLVQDLRVIQDTFVAKKINVSFLCPMEQDRNGTITSFVIRQTLLGADNKTITSTDSTVESKSSCNSENWFMVNDVLVDRTYSFAVKVINNRYEGEFGEPVRIYINPRVPQLQEIMQNFGVDYLVSEPVNSAIDLTTIRVEICARCLTDNSQGQVIHAGLVVCAKGQQCALTGRKKRSIVTNEVYEQLPTWKKAKVKYFTVGYRATPDNWIQTLNNSLHYVFTIGTDKNCDDLSDTVYCNGPLPSGKKFYVTVIVCTTAGCDTSTGDQVFATQQNIDGTPFQSPPVAAIAGGVVGGLAVLVIISVVVYKTMVSRRRNFAETRNTHTENVKSPAVTRDVRYNIPDAYRENTAYQQVYESTNAYVELQDSSYIESGDVLVSDYSSSDYSLVRPHEDLYDTLEFTENIANRNLATVNNQRQNRGGTNY